ncbi:MAG TPA: hypothetical protein VNR40_06665, partial [Steroidobacter sp.]|nr:hypothetical protein [Steroidobacter sp.]
LALGDMKTKSQKNLMLTVTACALAEALEAACQLDQALAVIDDALSHAPAGDETWEAPELLRVKASIILSMPQPDEAVAERCLLRAVELANQQGARGWELRATMTLARLRSMQLRSAEGRAQLTKIYDQFTEGLDTQDLRAARDLLQA